MKDLVTFINEKLNDNALNGILRMLSKHVDAQESKEIKHIIDKWSTINKIDSFRIWSSDPDDGVNEYNPKWDIEEMLDEFEDNYNKDHPLHPKNIKVNSVDVYYNCFVLVVIAKDYKFIISPGNVEFGKKNNNLFADKEFAMIPPVITTVVFFGMDDGYIEDGDIRYGLSEENIYDIFDNDEDKKEAEKAVKIAKHFGKKFKFKTNKEFLDKGFEDPTV